MSIADSYIFIYIYIIYIYYIGVYISFKENNHETTSHIFDMLRNKLVGAVVASFRII